LKIEKSLIKEITSNIAKSVEDRLISIYVTHRPDVTFSLPNVDLYQLFIILDERTSVNDILRLRNSLTKIRKMSNDKLFINYIFNYEELPRYYYYIKENQSNLIIQYIIWTKDVLRHVLYSSDFVITLRHLITDTEFIIGKKEIREWHLQRVYPWHCLYSFLEGITRYQMYLHELYLNEDIKRKYALFLHTAATSSILCARNTLLIKNVTARYATDIIRKFHKYFPNFGDIKLMNEIFKTATGTVISADVASRVFKLSLMFLKSLISYIVSECFC